MNRFRDDFNHLLDIVKMRVVVTQMAIKLKHAKSNKDTLTYREIPSAVFNLEDNLNSIEIRRIGLDLHLCLFYPHSSLITLING